MRMLRARNASREKDRKLGGRGLDDEKTTSTPTAARYSSSSNNNIKNNECNHNNRIFLMGYWSSIRVDFWFCLASPDSYFFFSLFLLGPVDADFRFR